MTMPRRSLLAALIAAACSGAAVNAHHSFAPVYNGDELVTVVGVVKEFRLVNPHAMLLVDVEDSGKIVTWTVEFEGLLSLSEFGWTADTIKAGERVTISGNPTHTRSPRMYFRKLIRADGSELLRGYNQRSLTVEEQRRQRAIKRDQRQ